MLMISNCTSGWLRKLICFQHKMRLSISSGALREDSYNLFMTMEGAVHLNKTSNADSECNLHRQC